MIWLVCILNFKLRHSLPGDRHSSPISNSNTSRILLHKDLRCSFRLELPVLDPAFPEAGLPQDVRHSVLSRCAQQLKLSFCYLEPKSWQMQLLCEHLLPVKAPSWGSPGFRGACIKGPSPLRARRSVCDHHKQSARSSACPRLRSMAGCKTTVKRDGEDWSAPE